MEGSLNHTAFQPKDAAAFETEADFVVVGSGAGGATFAVTAARAGHRVCIVEAGAYRDPPDYPSSIVGAMRDLFDDWSTCVTRGRAFWPVLQGCAVGGSTVINSAIAVRTPGDVFERWMAEGGVGGDPLARAVWEYQDQIEKELSVEPVPEASLGRHNRLALQGDAALGYEGHVMLRYVKGCLGSGQCVQGCRANRKQSTNVTYIPEVLQRGGSVLSCAPVRRVVFEGRKAVGVTGRFRHPQNRSKGTSFLVRARKAVVVAASATHSPALLERSGVRNPALGMYFRAHPGTSTFGCYEDPVDMNTGATQGWASTKFRMNPGLKLETLSLPLELVASRLAGAGTELMERLSEYRHFAHWIHAVKAESVGTVRNGLFDKPVVRYELHRRDMEVFREGLYLVAKMHFAAGAKAVLPGIFGGPFKILPDEVETLKNAPLDPRSYVAVLSHLFGGCIMGKDPARSVCDESGRVHGYEGLLISDASMIPSNLGVNPQHTIMGLARHCAVRASG